MWFNITLGKFCSCLFLYFTKRNMMYYHTPKKNQIVGRDSCVISLFSIVTTVNNSYYILYLLSSRFLGNKYAAKNATTGRPKGADLATTGLPAKRKMGDKLQKQKRPTLFIDKFSRYSTM